MTDMDFEPTPEQMIEQAGLTKATAPELDICSRCREHAEFEELDGAWQSTCCWAPAVSVDGE